MQSGAELEAVGLKVLILLFESHHHGQGQEEVIRGTEGFGF